MTLMDSDEVEIPILIQIMLLKMLKDLSKLNTANLELTEWSIREMEVHTQSKIKYKSESITCVYLNQSKELLDFNPNNI